MCEITALLVALRNDDKRAESRLIVASSRENFTDRIEATCARGRRDHRFSRPPWYTRLFTVDAQAIARRVCGLGCCGRTPGPGWSSCFSSEALAEDEAGDVLDVGARSAKRDWRNARA